jgi:hypothetical protein
MSEALCTGKNKMYISKQMKILCLIWLLTGIALMIWSVSELWRIEHNVYLGAHKGFFKSSLAGCIFGALCIAGPIVLMKKTTTGQTLLTLSALLGLLYGLFYFFTGGFKDTGIIYAAVIFALTLLSFITINIISKNSQDNGSFDLGEDWND